MLSCTFCTPLETRDWELCEDALGKASEGFSVLSVWLLRLPMAVRGEHDFVTLPVCRQEETEEEEEEEEREDEALSMEIEVFVCVCVCVCERKIEGMYQSSCACVCM